MTVERNKWVSKHPDRLPDFIIGGAMKSGTTSLHSILNEHPDVAIAREELGFFDIDCMIQHPDFNFYDSGADRWISQSMASNPQELWTWYERQFKDLDPNAKLIGEDSTTYLSSSVAAQRIAMQKKEIKLIFILRHPTKRTISNYLHKLKSGRAIYSLEDTLRLQPETIVSRSMYKSQLEVYYNYIPFENIKVVVFEDFVTNKKACLKDICQFLNLDFEKFDLEVFDTHSNKTKIPRSLKLQLIRNRLLIRNNAYRYSKALPIQPTIEYKMPLGHRIINKFHKWINPLNVNNKFIPKSSTLSFLDDHFKKELEGLDELVRIDILKKWF